MFFLAVLIAAGAALALYGWAAWIEPRRIQVVRHTLRLPASAGAPGGLRLVHLTDFHFERDGFLEKELERILKRERPDLLALTGDYLNGEGGRAALRRFLESADQWPTFAVFGNWRYFFDPSPQFQGFERIRLLDGESVEFEKNGVRIQIGGLNFPEPDLGALAGKAAAGPPFILLYHNSDLMKEASSSGVFLYLCGHTHGGQVRLPGIGPLVTFSKWGRKYAMGRHDVGGMTLYVSRGLGLEGGPGPRVRFLCRPEVAVFDLVVD